MITDLFEMLINTHRENNNLSKLRYSTELEYYAQIRAEEASKKWSHTRPNGQPWNSLNIILLKGEILGHGANPFSVFQKWIESQSHNDVILNDTFTSFGVGIFQDYVAINFH